MAKAIEVVQARRGGAPPTKKPDAAADDGDDSGDGDDDSTPAATKADETPDAKRDPAKFKSPEQLRKAAEKHVAKVTEFEKKVADHEKKVAEDARINDAATREFGPIAQGIKSYRDKNYEAFVGAAEKMTGDTWSTICRNVYDATKDGMSTAQLRSEISDLKRRLESGQAPATKEEKKETPPAAAADDGKKRAKFDKGIKAHEIHELDEDDELSSKAFKMWADSWDDELDEYALTPRQAADKVVEKAKGKARKLTGERTPAAGRAEDGRFTPSNKPRTEMTKEEKRKADMTDAQARIAARKRGDRRAP
jgi:hypothetical protein